MRRSSRGVREALCSGQKRRVEELYSGDVVDAAAGRAGSAGKAAVCMMSALRATKLDERGAPATGTACLNS
jgi:hypothetical protein